VLADRPEVLSGIPIRVSSPRQFIDSKKHRKGILPFHPGLKNQLIQELVDTITDEQIMGFRIWSDFAEQIRCSHLPKRSETLRYRGNIDQIIRQKNHSPGGEYIVLGNDIKKLDRHGKMQMFIRLFQGSHLIFDTHDLIGSYQDFQSIVIYPIRMK